MDRMGVVVLGAAAALMVGTAAYAQSGRPGNGNPSEVTIAPYSPYTPPQAELQRRPLFTFGGVNVDVWSPIEPPYDPNMNRAAASDPLWEEAP